jgi:hypothetical protein
VDSKASSGSSSMTPSRAAVDIVALHASSRSSHDPTTRVALVSVFRSIDGSQQERRLVQSSYVAIPLQVSAYKELLDAAYSGTAWIRSRSRVDHSKDKPADDARVLGRLVWPNDKPVTTLGDCLAMNQELDQHGMSVQVTHRFAAGRTTEPLLRSDLLESIRRTVFANDFGSIVGKSAR